MNNKQNKKCGDNTQRCLETKHSKDKHSNWCGNCFDSCPECHRNNKQKWEESFEKICFDWFTPNDKSKSKKLVRVIDGRYEEKIKSFITQLLAKQEKEIKEQLSK